MKNALLKNPDSAKRILEEAAKYYGYENLEDAVKNQNKDFHDVFLLAEKIQEIEHRSVLFAFECLNAKFIVYLCLFFYISNVAAFFYVLFK